MTIETSVLKDLLNKLRWHNIKLYEQPQLINNGIMQAIIVITALEHGVKESDEFFSRVRKVQMNEYDDEVIDEISDNPNFLILPMEIGDNFDKAFVADVFAGTKIYHIIEPDGFEQYVLNHAYAEVFKTLYERALSQRTPEEAEKRKADAAKIDEAWFDDWDEDYRIPESYIHLEELDEDRYRVNLDPNPWISVDDFIPKSGTDVFVAFDNGEVDCLFQKWKDWAEEDDAEDPLVYYDPDGTDGDNQPVWIEKRVTHWKHTLKPPVPEKKAEEEKSGEVIDFKTEAEKLGIVED